MSLWDKDKRDRQRIVYPASEHGDIFLFYNKDRLFFFFHLLSDSAKLEFESPLHESPGARIFMAQSNLKGVKPEPWVRAGHLSPGALTLQMVSSTHSADSPGWMMVSTGWSFGKHTQEGVRWSGTQRSLSVLGRGRLFTVPSSLFFGQRHQKAHSV